MCTRASHASRRRHRDPMQTHRVLCAHVLTRICVLNQNTTYANTHSHTHTHTIPPHGTNSTRIGIEMGVFACVYVRFCTCLCFIYTIIYHYIHTYIIYTCYCTDIYAEACWRSGDTRTRALICSGECRAVRWWRWLFWCRQSEFGCGVGVTCNGSRNHIQHQHIESRGLHVSLCGEAFPNPFVRVCGTKIHTYTLNNNCN